MLIVPLHGKVQSWAERRFHKRLLELREGLAETMRDLREIVSIDEFVQEVLSRINAGVLASRSALVLGREVKGALGIGQPEVLRWLLAFQPKQECGAVHCDPDDKLFPLRLRIEDSSGAFMGWVLVGPRPDGSIAGSDERQALEELAVPLALASDRPQPRAGKAGASAAPRSASPANREHRAPAAALKIGALGLSGGLAGAPHIQPLPLPHRQS